MIVGFFIILSGFMLMFSGASLMVREYCVRYLVAPKEGIQFVNMKMNGDYAVVNDGGKLTEFKDPVYRFVVAGKTPKSMILNYEAAIRAEERK